MTTKEALQIAKQNGLELEVKEMINHCAPEEALREWDLFHFCNINKNEKITLFDLLKQCGL